MCSLLTFSSGPCCIRLSNRVDAQYVNVREVMVSSAGTKSKAKKAVAHTHMQMKKYKKCTSTRTNVRVPNGKLICLVAPISSYPYAPTRDNTLTKRGAPGYRCLVT